MWDQAIKVDIGGGWRANAVTAPAQLDVDKCVRDILLVDQLAVPVLHVRNIPEQLQNMYPMSAVQ